MIFFSPPAGPPVDPLRARRVRSLGRVSLSPDDPVRMVYVSHVVHQNQFFAHRQEDTVHLNALSARLARHGDSEGLPTLSRAPEAGEYLLARYSCDRNWYRCRVEAVDGEGRADVTYVDYGNRELVCAEDLKPMPESLARQHAFAVECGMTHLRPVSRDLWQGEGRKLFAKLFGQER